MQTLLIVAVWLIVGYILTLLFVHKFLDNKRWADTGKEPGAFMLIMLTLVLPIMAPIIGILAGLEWLFTGGFGSLIKRGYGLR